jgi:hypothetical protein
MLKECRTCKKVKDIDVFPTAKNNKDGHRNECKSCYAAYYREYYKKDPERYKQKSRNQKNHRRHGISDDQYEALLAQHDGKCHLCLKNKATVIDHDHSCCNHRSCGKCVRGVLCSSCNTAIGMLKEDPEVIDRIKEYIIRRIGEQASRHSSKVQ